MTILGIVGGIAPPSTLEYYRRLVDGYRRRVTHENYPHIIIDSINLRPMIEGMEARDYERVTQIIVESLTRLRRAGAELALLGSNTPHMLFREIQAVSPVPLISIVQTASDAVKASGARVVGLLGTRFTMEGGFYQRVFADAGIRVEVPSAEERERLHACYMSELVPGKFHDQTRELFLLAVDHMRDDAGIEAVVLAGTELPLLLPMPSHRGLPLFDTASLHVECALNAMVGA